MILCQAEYLHVIFKFEKKYQFKIDLGPIVHKLC